MNHPPFLTQPPPPPNLQPVTFNLENKISPSVLFIIIVLAIIFFVSGLLHWLVRFLLRPTAREPDDLENATALQAMQVMPCNLLIQIIRIKADPDNGTITIISLPPIAAVASKDGTVVEITTLRCEVENTKQEAKAVAAQLHGGVGLHNFGAWLPSMPVNWNLMIDLWILMDTPDDERHLFDHVTCNISSSVDEVTILGALTLDLIEQTEGEARVASSKHASYHVLTTAFPLPERFRG
ncbi:hypothetical protein Nepgr_021309 [Nepenthes gracilis]|uniref:Transmembrane protein n=1 Tax=Nepenthes gracilis TaxID=150966 RepID=A0AAD3XW01_NEPGR|nr:hypothetical protein Nepgr_021309 [Nepenthes gracilis]